MYIFVEMWKPKPSWLALSKEAREQYLNQVAPALQAMVDNGVEIIAWSLNDAATPYTTDHIYLGVYKFPTREQTVQFEQMVSAAGWYDYFYQINAKGVADMPQSIIEHMLGN